MAIGSSAIPRGFLGLSEKFRPFGHVNSIFASIPVYDRQLDREIRIVLAEYELTLMIQPFGAAIPVTGRYARTLAYAAAEEAIAMAEQDFFLLDEPELRVTGGKRNFLEVLLTLRFRERRPHD